MNRKKIKEAIVVEGRDDADVVSRAFDTLIICTHGFGIKRETWELIEKAHREKGIIILTDPDFSGEEIRRRLTARFPDAGQAYMPRDAAIRDDDIGVENASPEDVAEAIEKAHCSTAETGGDAVTAEDLEHAGLAGAEGSARMRELVAAELGIGYGNGKTFLKKLNAFGITGKELERAVGIIGEDKK